MAPRIPYRPASVLPLGIPPLNLFRMWSHSPSTLPHLLSLGTTCFLSTSLSPQQRELLCLLSATRLKCVYQSTQHIPIARTAGVSEAQITALLLGDIENAVWTDSQKALLRFADAVIIGTEVSDGIFDTARAYFGDGRLVEIVTVLGFYHSLAKIATVFRVELEPKNPESP